MGDSENGKFYPKKPPVSKEAKFGWKVIDEPGEFMHLDKKDIRIDHTYQRNEISIPRIQQIRAEFYWAAFGCLSVAYRSDGSFWVYDGQHRLLAVLEMDSITEVPCLIFEADDVGGEAENFIRANTVRGPVAAWYKYRAALVAGKSVETGMRDVIEKSGYHMTRGGSGNKTVSCVRHLVKQYEADAAIFERVWSLCVQLYDGDSVIGEVFTALCYFEGYINKNKCGSIVDADTRSRIIACGKHSILGKIKDAYSDHEKGGPKVASSAIVKIVNGGRKSRNKIRCPMKAPTSNTGGEGDE